MGGTWRAVDCPFEGGYDYKIGTSDRAKLRVDDRKFKAPPFKHLLVVCGGSDGLEDSVENDEALGMAGSDASKLFNAFVRTTPKVVVSSFFFNFCSGICRALQITVKFSALNVLHKMRKCMCFCSFDRLTKV